MSKSATHALFVHLATRNDIPEKSDTCCILPTTIDTPGNRAGMPDADMSTWIPPTKLADLVSAWAKNENRPANGSFARVSYQNECVVTSFV